MSRLGADRIKNVALAGHAGSGKTSLAEAMMFKAGVIDRQGRVADGNTVCDFDPEEIKRKASLSLSVAQFGYNDVKLNLLDTPGLFDFTAGLYEGVSAADSVLIAVSGKSGVTVGAKKAYKLAKQRGKATMFFVGKMDSENADFYKVLESLKTEFGPSVCPIVVPFVQDGKVDCYVNLLEMRAYRYGKNGIAVQTDMPDSEHRLDGLIAAISEAIAETDEELFEKFFSGEQFTYFELVSGLHNGIKSGSITPVLCGSAQELEGIDILLEAVAKMLPSAAEASGREAVCADSVINVDCDADSLLSAYVFKTVADPFVGKLSYIKVVSGVLTAESPVVNMTSGQPEKIGKLLNVRGKKQEEAKEAAAGDFVAVTKLSALTGDTLCDPKRQVVFEKVEFPAPCYSLAVKTSASGDESKISSGVHRLLEEDLTLGFELNTETHQQILSGLGEQHLDVAVSKLKNKFGVSVELEAPIIAYRETIRKKVKAEGKHKKQTGGHGQYGHVVIEFEPWDCDEMVFEEKVFGGSVPKGYFPAVEKGLRDSVLKGVLAGYPVVGLKATLLDGSYHPVDSSEMAFKTAAGIAYRDGISQASPILLEPIGLLRAIVPDDKTGDLMGDLNKRRGRVLGMNPEEQGYTLIEANAPMSEMQDFANTLRQMTQGDGSFTISFERYEPLPEQLQAAVIQKAAEIFGK
ncbi:MAG: elongation factor G [Oscillospiraceae bacterium]|nr:elongation factor G [Oscillospiraceae bacterium]